MKKVGIVGLGNMGESIVRALLNAGVDKSEIIAYEKMAPKTQTIRERYGIEAADSPADLASHSRYVIIAVKPQDAKAAIAAVASGVSESTIVISIMAGVTASTVSELLGKAAKIVRVMPNLCISIGEGAVGIAANDLLTKEELEAVGTLLGPLGRVVDVSEEQMDAVTALAGSGPAFVLSFLEAMIDGGVRMGLPRDKAYGLALQTMKGTVDMLDREKLHPALMKEAVTSPGGTTIAGLVILDEKGFKGNVVRALEAAQNRARELSK